MLAGDYLHLGPPFPVRRSASRDEYEPFLGEDFSTVSEGGAATHSLALS